MYKRTLLTWTHLLKPPANLNKTWFPLTQFFSYLLPTHPNNFLFSLGVWVGRVLLYVFLWIPLVPINFFLCEEKLFKSKVLHPRTPTMAKSQLRVRSRKLEFRVLTIVPLWYGMWLQIHQISLSHLVNLPA